MKITLSESETATFVKKDVELNQLDPISQKFKAYEVFTGIGDSTKVFVKLGYMHRINDSLQNNRLSKVNTSNTYYLDSKWIQTQKTNLVIGICLCKEFKTLRKNYLKWVFLRSTSILTY